MFATVMGSVAVFMWTIIAALFIGAVVGLLARMILPGKQKMTMWSTIVLGFSAALIGGLVAQGFGIGDTAGVDWVKLAIQVGLAVLFVGFYTGWFFRR